MRLYEPIIVINEAAIHHICVTARKSGPGGLGSRRIRAPSGSNKCRANGKTAKERGSKNYYERNVMSLSLFIDFVERSNFNGRC